MAFESNDRPWIIIVLGICFFCSLLCVVALPAVAFAIAFLAGVGLASVLLHRFSHAFPQKSLRAANWIVSVLGLSFFLSLLCVFITPSASAIGPIAMGIGMLTFSSLTLALLATTYYGEHDIVYIAA